ncbi:histone H1 [Alistipes putredinis]|uniref:histone H1 n=1 Tax=Alistipes putredinis TaxID=28117 RepID=UPI00242D2266|nr:histone H1 [Alistipes putredinis]MBS6652188.1 histone H1 [Alistipes putredinis]
MKELLEKMYAEMDAVKANAQLQHENGNKAAGMRTRKASLLKEFHKKSLTIGK